MLIHQENHLDLDTLAEPYRIKVVEKIHLPSRREREDILHRAHHSVFRVGSTDVLIDLATDSGTGAMSDCQWAAMMRGDETHIRSRSFFEFERTVQQILGYPHVIPTHQGRAAEHLLLGSLVNPGDFVLSNTHFITTRAHVIEREAVPVDLVGDEFWRFSEEAPFKGNFDLVRLEAALARHHVRVPFILITILNDYACSSPVSMENIRETRRLADRFHIPVYFDACRFAENAWFIKTREEGYSDVPIQEIVHEMFAYGHGCWMSARKDANVNIGGFLALRDESIAARCQERLVLDEGFPACGGLAPRR